MAGSDVLERALAIRGGTAVSDTPVPFMSLGLTEDDVEAAVQVLRSGMLRAASRCADLEARIAELSGARHGIACANGTCALQLAYGAMLEPGDEVIVPAWTFIATASMIAGIGCIPVFCDVDPESFQIDVADAEKRITDRTKAIACTHLYGMPVDIDAVEALAERTGLRVIYDAAQAHLATYKGQGIGAFGDAVTYSFYATKNLGTGEGGMVTANDDDLARRIRLLSSHGETDKYIHDFIGFNYRLNDIAAAIGCSKLDHLPDQTAARRRVADRYDEMLADFDGVHAPKRTPGADAAWHLYTVRLDLGAFTCTRDEFCAALKAEGVPTAVHYPRSLTRQPAFARWVKEHMSVADALTQQVFCLPMHHDVSEEHLRIVREALEKVTGAFGG